MDSLVEPIFTRRGVNRAQKVVQLETNRLKSQIRKGNLLSVYNAQNPGNGNLAAGVPVQPPFRANNLIDVGSHASINLTPSLYPLQETANFFIRHAGKEFIATFFDLPNRYEILNNNAERILWAGETLEEFGNRKDAFGVKGPAFDVTILGPNGGGLLNVVSNGHGITTISDFHQILGTVIDTSSPFAPHERYSIRDWNMSETFKLKKSIGGVGEYGIFTKDNLNVGKYSSNWNTEVPNYVSVDRLYGMIVPEDMVTEQKCLLMGTLFTLFYQQLHCEEDKSDKCTAWALCIGIPILLILILIGLIIYFVSKEKD